MSVTKDKTLAKVRTFAQDFKEHQPPGTAEAVSDQTKTTTIATTEKKVKAGENVLKAATEHKTVPHTEEKQPTKPVPKITVQSQSKKATSAIPSYHEIEKAAKQKTHVAPKKNIKVQKRPTTSSASSATVITATKKAKKKKTSPSLFASVRTWFKNLFAKKSSTPQYQVPAAGRRKGVVEKATTKTGVIFTADNERLREEILRRRKKEAEAPDVSWNANTEPVYELLPGATAHTTPEIKTPTPALETIPKQKPEPEALPVSQPSQTDTKEPAPKTPVMRWATHAKEPDKVESVQQEDRAAIPIIEEPAETIDESVMRPATTQIKLEPFKALRNLFRGSFESIDTNAMSLGIVSMFAAIFIVIVGAQFIFTALQPDTTTVENTSVSPILTSNPVLEIVPADSSKNALVSGLKNALSNAAYPEQEIAVTTLGGSLLPAKQLVSLIDLRINPNFAQTITNVRFVAVDKVQYAVIFTVTDSVTALGGMLSWEENIADDLKEYLHTIELPSESTGFVDDTINDIDVRILTDGVDEVLVYGFIDDNTILITKTTATFARLSPR